MMVVVLDSRMEGDPHTHHKLLVGACVSHTQSCLDSDTRQHCQVGTPQQDAQEEEDDVSGTFKAHKMCVFSQGGPWGRLWRVGDLLTGHTPFWSTTSG